MRELVYYVAVSLDGYIAGPNGEYDAFLADGEHMEALNRRFADAIPTAIAARLGIHQPGTTFGAVVMGWNTYDVGLRGGVDSPYRHLEQIVFSAGHSGSGENLTVTDRDPVEVVRELKGRPGADIWLCGGGQLASALLHEIDRLVIKRNPVLFGNGIRMFGDSAYRPEQFTLQAATAYESGVVVSEYVRSEQTTGQR
jgi:dihydrofolate reductase